jgi:CcmD family protein
MNSVFAAYAVAFAAIVLYMWFMASRRRKMARKRQLLKEQLNDSSRSYPN